MLEIEAFSLGFNTDTGTVPVVEEVGFTVGRGETVGLVGESGCGKSVTAMSVMRLLPSPPALTLGGRILFEGQDLLTLGERQMRAIRGDQISMVFQEPMTSLNPTYSVGFQIREALALHRPLGRRALDARSADLLGLVGIGSPDRRLRQYPHELSGGLRQRVMIAMAIACEPKLIIADEPTTALDVTIQAQILDLLRDLREKLATAILLITHDLGVVAEFCERVIVMYAGRIVETAPVPDLFERPRHPYTAGLLDSIPTLGRRGHRLSTIPGTVPPPGRRGRGCPFVDRCRRSQERCRQEVPILGQGGEAAVACWNPLP